MDYICEVVCLSNFYGNRGVYACKMFDEWFGLLF